VSAVFRLDTSFGGGKTHGLIALVHAAAGMKGVSNIAEFLDPAIVPARPVRGFELSSDPAAPTRISFDLDKHFLPAVPVAVLDVAGALVLNTLDLLPPARRRTWVDEFQADLGRARRRRQQLGRISRI
jgi:hypothetical protein